MSEQQSGARSLHWQQITRPDGAVLEQAPARNNSWYLLVAENGACTLRYASQSANAVIGRELTPEAARGEAERHADRYDTRV